MREAAMAALRLTAQDLRKLGVIDQIIAEPLGGAQRKRQAIICRRQGDWRDAEGTVRQQARPPCEGAARRSSWRWGRRGSRREACHMLYAARAGRSRS